MAETLDPVNKQIPRVCALAHNGSLYLNIEASKNEGWVQIYVAFAAL